MISLPFSDSMWNATPERQPSDGSHPCSRTPCIQTPALLLFAPSLSAENMDSFHTEVYFCRNCGLHVSNVLFGHLIARRGGCGGVAYALGVVKVLHDDGLDVSIVILHPVSYRNEVATKHTQTLSALMIIARSSIGLRPAKSTTCEMSSSEGSMDAMATDGRS